MIIFKKGFFESLFLTLIASQVFSKAIDETDPKNLRCGKDIGVCSDGSCCSKDGWCGNTDSHCNVDNGCQIEFGACNEYREVEIMKVENSEDDNNEDENSEDDNNKVENNEVENSEDDNNEDESHKDESSEDESSEDESSKDESSEDESSDDESSDDESSDSESSDSDDEHINIKSSNGKISIGKISIDKVYIDKVSMDDFTKTNNDDKNNNDGKNNNNTSNNNDTSSIKDANNSDTSSNKDAKSNNKTNSNNNVKSNNDAKNNNGAKSNNDTKKKNVTPSYKSCKTSNNLEGVCVKKSDCVMKEGQVGSAKYYPGFCLSDSEDVLCCVKTVSQLSDGTKLLSEGICKNISECPANQRIKNQCPGNSNVQLCVDLDDVTQKVIDDVESTVSKVTDTIGNALGQKGCPGSCKNPLSCAGEADSDNYNFDIILDGLCSTASQKCCIPKHNDKESDYNFIEVLSNPEGDTLTSISDFKDALVHYRGKSGKTVPANSHLIGLILNDDTFREKMKIIKYNLTNRVKEAQVGETIKSKKDSYVGLDTPALGSYRLDIEYSFVVKEGKNSFLIHCFGENRWDFVKTGNGWWYDLFHEDIPHILAKPDFGKNLYVK
ncbi:carbohydrate-binding module family 18 protein [Piromyces sp. E2]|nr:carbohydrate-binding module family 18 protein [Piromyces sp. E2]|eukprot:OUM64392.1 carbohydrate-binding module family 18 protein [Piromyces sp. E2]